MEGHKNLADSEKHGALSALLLGTAIISIKAILKPERKTMTEKYQHALYRSPIELPEAKRGNISVKHRIVPPGETIPVVGMRQAYLRGIRPLIAKLDHPHRIHELHDKQHGMWMTDSPEELNQIAEMLFNVMPEGRVLVGGLGLGVLAETLAQRLDVDEVVVVERDKNIIKLCATVGHYEVQHQDILCFLQKHTDFFDYYLLDTWQGTNESAYWETVLPLRRAIRSRAGRLPMIHCWAEDIMWDQVEQSLSHATQKGWYYEGLPDMKEDEAKWFLSKVGTTEWEQHYGKVVDAIYARMEKKRKALRKEMKRETRQ